MKLPTKPLICALVCAALGAFMPGTALAVDPGINQPGKAGNVGRDPGKNQPGAEGNVGGAGKGVDPGSINLGPRATSGATRASTSPARRGTAGVLADRGRRWKEPAR